MNVLEATYLDQLISEVEAQVELDTVISTESLADKILNAEAVKGNPLPWAKIWGKFDLRPGEVTIWAGDNGSGKSLIVGQVMTWLLAQGETVLIASMEMRPEETVRRMLHQAAGRQPGEKWVRSFCGWADSRLWIYDQLDTVESSRILQMVRAVAQRLGVTHVVIDSLVKCGVAQDGNGYLTAQTSFVDSLQHAAKHLGVHIHLIAHTRKPERDSGRVTKHDVRGASQITDLADNVALVARNRSKERVLQIPPDQWDDDDREVLEQPDTFLTVAKQRHYSWEGTMGLDYLHESMQFVPAGAGRALPWPDASLTDPWRREVADEWVTGGDEYEQA